MGIPEALYGLGALILLGALVYGVARAGRKKPSAAAVEATKRNFDKA